MANSNTPQLTWNNQSQKNTQTFQIINYFLK